MFTRSKFSYAELANGIAGKFSVVAMLTDFDEEVKLPMKQKAENRKSLTLESNLNFLPCEFEIIPFSGAKLPVRLHFILMAFL